MPSDIFYSCWMLEMYINQILDVFQLPIKVLPWKHYQGGLPGPKSRCTLQKDPVFYVFSLYEGVAVVVAGT